ncbi:MAG: transketolase family protein [Candidatus Nomurabacteria bacterium]|jgi:transketolase|nr:transketolase family protein [Candidatus Nomurabacteria bacterium]
MIDFNLNERFLRGDFENKAVREGFGEGLVEVARNNEKVVALTGDVGDSVGLGEFIKEFPERFVEVGIAEQNLVTIASGMASMGMIPFAAAYAAFSPGRCWEQIRTSICLNNMPVKIVGSHAGVNAGPDGAAHQILEDIALMRSLPNMIVVAPGDSVEAEKVAVACAKDSRPNYLRLARAPSPIFSSDNSPFEIGRAYVLREGSDVSICTTGTMTAQALLAAQILEKQGIFAEVVHCPTIKPLDSETILQSARKTGRVVTVEEHQIAGGFGSAVAELLSQNSPTLMKIIGINDRFGQSGAADELLDFYGLTAPKIANILASWL